jgi:capsular exopolysaccharide synthesis family protein
MRIVSPEGADSRSAGFDMLRTRVLRMMEENGWRTLAVTSPDPGCGKSVVSVNLAFSMARQPDRSVILVDMDLRRPSVGRCLGLQPKHDLQSVLKGDVSLQAALMRPALHDRERLTVLLNRSPIANAAEVVASQNIRELVADLRGRDASRIVIFDTAPVLTADEAVAFLPYVDCALLVAAVGSTRASSIEDADRQLAATNLLGVVLNKAREPVDSYGY